MVGGEGMKKQSYRQYALEAFRFLSREGSADKYIKKLLEDYGKQQSNAGVCNPTEAALVHKDKILRDHAAELADLDAAGKAMMLLFDCERRAVEMVYQKDCWRDIAQYEMESRVITASIDTHSDRASIYRWLSKACKVFAVERGLRT
jgi:hypothetical protein